MIPIPLTLPTPFRPPKPPKSIQSPPRNLIYVHPRDDEEYPTPTTRRMMMASPPVTVTLSGVTAAIDSNVFFSN